jgi:hypothetical protein
VVVNPAQVRAYRLGLARVAAVTAAQLLPALDQAVPWPVRARAFRRACWSSLLGQRDPGARRSTENTKPAEAAGHVWRGPGKFVCLATTTFPENPTPRRGRNPRFSQWDRLPCG